MLEDADLDVDLFWEVKANLTAKHVRALGAAGVHTVQPGIESLSDNVLGLMRKGTTGLKNIEFLKWCSEYGVTPVWNLLYGFPGETAADYEEIRDLIEAIWHLDPPRGTGCLRLDRFSPYHDDPAALGMENVRPNAAVLHLYPFPSEDVMEMAYYFDFDYADGRRANAHVGRTLEITRTWMADDDRGMLSLEVAEDGTVHLDDSRPTVTGEPERIVLEGWRAAVFLACDRAKGARELMELPEVQASSVSDGELREFLADCVRRKLMVRNDRSWLNVAVHVPARESAAEPRQLTATAAGI
jgi:ribosomal peptide maturation radical SAM protein 1